MKKTKILTLSLLAILSLVGCQKGGTTVKDTSSVDSHNSENNNGKEVTITDSPKIRVDNDASEDDIYDAVFEQFNDVYSEAEDILDSSERYVKFAEAEAQLLDTAAFMPLTTSGGSYVITHAAFRSLPFIVRVPATPCSSETEKRI